MGRFSLEPLEDRTLLAGVTLLVHGYQGNITGWVAKVADDITARAGGTVAVTQYVMSVAKSGNELVVQSTARENGFNSPTATSTAEIVIKLDWSTVSGGAYSTGEVAQVVGNYLLTSPVDGVRLAELPMHLIGHSRGASLCTALAQLLGRAGVWVDQQTNLDPHPVDGVNDFLNVDYGDQTMATFDNVAFADTYWRTDGQPNNIDADGEPVAGSHNSDLQNSVEAESAGAAHNAVPSYYDGTVDLTATDGGDTPIFDSWYEGTADKPARDATGYFFSRIAAGPRPVDGLWAASSGNAPRTAAGQNGLQWGNITDARVLGKRVFQLNESLAVRFIRQDRDSGDTVELLMDVDTNPFNNNFVRTMRRVNVAESDAITPARQNAATGGAPIGRYWVCARIRDGHGHYRFAYSAWFKIEATPAITQSASEKPQMFSEHQIAQNCVAEIELLA